MVKRDGQSLAEQRLPVLPGRPGGLGLVRERSTLHRYRAELFGDLPCPPREHDRLSETHIRDPKAGDAGVSLGQFDGRAEWLQSPQRVCRCGGRFAATAEPPQGTGAPAQGVAFAQRVTGLAPQPECPLVGIGGAAEAVDHAQLIGQLVIAGGERRWRFVAGEAERPLELRGCFAMRAKLDRAAPGQRGVVQRGRPVAGRLGVEGQPGVVFAARVEQRSQDAGVDGRQPVPGDRLFHRTAGDLVPEPQRRPIGDQQAGFSQIIHHLWRGGGGPLEQPRLDRCADQRRDIEHAARWRPEPCGAGQDRVPG